MKLAIWTNMAVKEKGCGARLCHIVAFKRLCIDSHEFLGCGLKR